MVKLSAPRRIRTYFPLTCITTMFLGAWRGLYIVRVYLFKMLTTPLSASREGLSTWIISTLTRRIPLLDWKMSRLPRSSLTQCGVGPIVSNG